VRLVLQQWASRPRGREQGQAMQCAAALQKDE